jgi:hypothetical protein
VRRFLRTFPRSQHITTTHPSSIIHHQPTPPSFETLLSSPRPINEQIEQIYELICGSKLKMYHRLLLVEKEKVHK